MKTLNTFLKGFQFSRYSKYVTKCDVFKTTFVCYHFNGTFFFLVLTFLLPKTKLSLLTDFVCVKIKKQRKLKGPQWRMNKIWSPFVAAFRERDRDRERERESFQLPFSRFFVKLFSLIFYTVSNFLIILSSKSVLCQTSQFCLFWISIQ